MEEIRNIFLGTHNFKNFKSQGSVQFSDVKTISQFRYFEREFPTLCNDQESIIIKGIVIKANGFLYKMMRNIVGAIIEVLREKRTVKELKAMLHLTSVPFVIPTAPAKGLTLVEVEY
jgi:tRNA pseudouridine38-40 synthase